MLEIFELYAVTHSVILQVKSEVFHLTSEHPYIRLSSHIQVFHLIQFIECQTILTSLHELCKDQLLVHFVKVLRLLLDFILELLLLVLELRFLGLKLGDSLQLFRKLCSLYGIIGTICRTTRGWTRYFCLLYGCSPIGYVDRRRNSIILQNFKQDIQVLCCVDL